MNVESWDPDLRSLFARYEEGTLDLQPSFQRGLVWNREKKARLLDTLLRGWRIPPVHYLVESDRSLSILDGQQRLQAIFDFLQNKWPLGHFPPSDWAVDEMRGRKFEQLNPSTQRLLFDSRISGYRLSDYEPDEPYELFFRLNLPTGLTQAEKRNALAGRTREQVRELVVAAEKYGWGGDLLGFGDGRMAYDDVLARTCAYLNVNTLRLDLSPKEMEALYRDPDGFPNYVVEIARAAMETVTHVLKSATSRVRLNKATLLTWLLVASRIVRTEYAGLDLAEALFALESGRALLGRRDPDEIYSSISQTAEFGPLVALYANRASLRVSDILSVQARDAVAWIAVGESNTGRRLPENISSLIQATGNSVHRGRQGFEEFTLKLLVEHPDWSTLR